MIPIPQSLNNIVSSFAIMIAIINIILHLIFASAVARDAGRLVKIGRSTYLVSGITWAFAALVGGVIIAAIYWFIHYSALMRKGETHEATR